MSKITINEHMFVFVGDMTIINSILVVEGKKLSKDLAKLAFEHLPEVNLMALDLWKNHTYNEMNELFSGIIEHDHEEVFLYKVKEEYVGFVYGSIRQDYVEGSSSSPTGFVEGIYVKPNYREQGIAKELIKKIETWALSQGCTEMGSDVEFGNDTSNEFHKKVGFKEANRLICFIKKLS